MRRRAASLRSTVLRTVRHIRGVKLSNGKEWVYIAVLLLLFFSSRIPAMLRDTEINVDESQMLAQAMRFERDLTPWRSVDSTTSGPVSSWLLLFAHKLGAPFGYRMAHCMAALCLAASLLLLQRTVRNLTSPATGLIILAVAVCWLALLPHDDYVHYSSELVPGLLLTGAAALITQPDAGRGYWRLWLSGLILGVIPWTKLQAIPIGAALGLWVLWRVNWDEDGSRRWVKVLSLVGAALLPTIVMLFWIGGAGAWHDFRQSYIIANFSYAGSKPLAHMLRDIGALLFLHPITFTWFLTAACLALLAAVIPRRPFEGASFRSFGFSMIWLAAAMFAIVKPVTQFGHYQLFIVFPLAVLGGVLVQPVIRFPVPVRWKAAILGLCLVPAVGILGPSTFKTHWAALTKRSDATPIVSDQLWLLERFRAHAPHARSLAIWGWAPSLYVEAGIPPATRHAIHHFLHAPHQARAFLRASFLRDLQAELPDAIVLIDILHLGPLLGPSETIDKVFPELARILQKNYHINQGEQRGEIGMWVCTRKSTS